MATGPNLLKFNDVEITDQGRTFDEERDERMAEVELASGRIKRYIKAEKKIFNIEWKYLPQDDDMTHDGKGARDSIKALAMTGNTITVRARNSIGEEDIYTMFFDSYTEHVVRRDFSSGIFLYDVSISLKEQ